MNKDFGQFVLSFEHSSALSTALQKGPQQVIDLVRQGGGKFLRVRQNGTVQYHPDPIVEMDDEGNFILSLEFEHDLLAHTPLETANFRDFKAQARLTFLRKSSTVQISQVGGYESPPETLDSLAMGQLALGCVLYRLFRPKYGFIDEGGANAPSPRMVKNTELKSILWTNFLGPAYVEKFGHDFLMEAPGWKKERLDDGGILYVVTKSFSEWWTKPPKDIVEYFRTQIPGIKTYRAKSSDW
jgi:hypothetical protein